MEVLGVVISQPNLCHQILPQQEKSGSGPFFPQLRWPHCGMGHLASSPRLWHLSGSVARTNLK